VSVLICVRDGERYLGRAIESALGQTVPPAEVIVVDDGSIDGSAAVAASYGPPVRCIGLPALGLGAARNAAIEAASGDYVAYLDSDDVWPDDRLEVQLEAFARDPGLDLVFGHVRVFGGAEAAAGPPAPGPFGGTLLFPRPLAQRVGRFPTDVRVGEFMDWLMRARELGLREAIVPEVVLLRRSHDTNITGLDSGNLHDYVRVLKASIDRRRGD
jgi:glycosyltransferase involved in cell wall biosynthesis